MRIGDEIYVHGYVDEIREEVGTVIVRNDWGYFGTSQNEVREIKEEDIECISDDVREEIGVGKNYNPNGRTESAMIVIGDVLKEAYCSGYADGLSDRIKSDYDRGYEAAKAKNITHEKAIDFLNDEGWLEEHDKALTLDYTPCKDVDARCDKAYQDGYNKGVADTTANAIEVVKQMGKQEDADIEVAENAAYYKGMDDLHNAILTVLALDDLQKSKIFKGYIGFRSILMKFTPTEIIEAVREHQKKVADEAAAEKQDDGIREAIAAICTEHGTTLEHIADVLQGIFDRGTQDVGM